MGTRAEAKQTVRRQPQRTCISCQRTVAKRELLRIVRSPDGRVAVDLKGKAAGRGAYVCPNRHCLLAALQRNRLERALEVTLSTEQRAELEAYAAGLPEGPAEVVA